MKGASLVTAIAIICCSIGPSVGKLDANVTLSSSEGPTAGNKSWDKAFLSPSQDAELGGDLANGIDAEPASSGEGEDEEQVISTASLLTSVVVAYVGAAMANSAGVGGGAVFVPIFNLVMGQDLKHATAMSQVMVTAGALVGVVLNWPKSNPLNPGRMLIEVDFVLLLMPAMLLGISIGVLFNVALQVWLQKILMVALFTYLAKMTLSKGMKLFRKEMRARAERKEQGLLQQTLHGTERAQSRRGSLANDADSTEVAVNQAAGIDAQTVPENAVLPPVRKVEWGSYSVLVGLWVVYFSFSLMHHTRPFCVRCSGAFWALYAFMVALTASITCGILFYLCKKHGQERLAEDADTEDGMHAPLLAGESNVHCDDDEVADIDWSMHNLVKCTLIMFSAGVMAGFMGIGGGMIMSPLLLTLNVHPQVTAATSSLMVFFSSSSAFVQLALEGLIDPWSALSFGVLAMMSSATGVLMVRKVIDRYGTTSIIVLVLGSFIAASAVIILVSGIHEIEVLDKSAFRMFNNICSPQGGAAEDDDEIDLATCFK